MSVLIVIPARFASVRYPGKPLVELTGASGRSASLIERTWEAARAVSGVDRVVVATDDDRIREASEGFGAEVVMTSSECRNGTERCAEAHDKLGGGYDTVVNLQGDAPLTPPWFLESLIEAMQKRHWDAATPVLRCNGFTLSKLLADRRAGRVGGTTAVFGSDNAALYFSKEVIPFTGREFDDAEESPVFHHVGVYAYSSKTLAEYPGWPVGTLESLEGLEQLRFLEQGHRMVCVEVEAQGRQFWELNNPEDVPVIEGMMQEMGLE